MNIEKILLKIIQNPYEAWPKETYFHKRNREKIERSLRAWHQRIPGLSSEELIYVFSRFFGEYSGPVLHIMSRGGSGCHYACEILEACLPFSSAHAEVYLPIQYVNENSPKVGDSLMNLLNLLDIFHIPSIDGSKGILNIGHMSSENCPSILRKSRKNAKFILLKRHPYDIVVSRALRKSDYRARTCPDLGDLEYFEQQAKTLRNFILRSSKEIWDAEISYEELVLEPLKAFVPVLKSLSLPYKIDISSERLFSEDSGSWGNLNTKPKPFLDSRYTDILERYLSDDILILWGYEPR